MAWKFFTQGREKTATPISGSQVGLINFFAGSTPPPNWLLCNGQQVSRSLYPQLDSLIGHVYGPYTDGNGNAGTTHFRLPDLRGRAAAGFYAGAGEGSTGTGSPTGTVISDRALGSWHGSENVTLTTAQTGQIGHSHTVTGGSHTHTLSGLIHDHNYSWANNPYESNTGNTINSVLSKNVSGSDQATQTSSTGISITSKLSNITINSINATSASSHSNMQPYCAVNYIILAQ